MNTRSRRLLLWSGSAAVAVAATGWAMYREVTTFGRPEPIQTGLDFLNSTWRAVRGLLSGANIYAPAHVTLPGIGSGVAQVSPHTPGSLLWQAPFAALPPRAAVVAYAFASILAIWAGVFILTRPRDPSAVFLATGCGAFAVCFMGGPTTLLLGQPTGFALLGLAVLIRARRPWLAGLGFMLAASTIQTGLPLALALLVLGRWPVVWRGIVLVAACSLPPVSLEIANAGFRSFVASFVSGGGIHLVLLSHRIDLGAFLQRLGVTSVAVQVGAGILIAALALAFLARLPPHMRRIENPPVLCLVIAFTLLCTYHEPYDMLLVGGVMIPIILLNDQSRAMMPSFALAGTSAGLSSYTIILVYAPIALLGIGTFSALALLRTSKSHGHVVAEREEAGVEDSATWTSQSGATSSPDAVPVRDATSSLHTKLAETPSAEHS